MVIPNPIANLSFQMDGGYARYMKVPESMIRSESVLRVPDSVSNEEACLVEPAACALESIFATPHPIGVDEDGRHVFRAGIQRGGRTCVIGSGTMGITYAALALCEGARDFAPQFGPQVTCVDTVMSRMCRFAGPEESQHRPMWAGQGRSLVVEDYDYLPIDGDLCSGGPFGTAFSMVSHAEFLCWEDIKAYLHNGMHAFVSCHGYLEKARFLCDVSPRIRESARRVVLDEVVPAIARNHPVVGIREMEHYGLSLLERFFNPYFSDPVERGIRGLEEKLAPNERLLGGCDYIRRAGIEPKGYAGTIEAAKEIMARQPGVSEGVGT